MMVQLTHDKKLTVVHSVSRWLTLTETWLYNQIKFLPPGIENYIVCGETENLDLFPIKNLLSFADTSLRRQLWDKGLRKLRFRRHLGFLLDQAKRHHARILHSHFGNVGWINAKGARKAGLKHIVTFYGLDIGCLTKRDPHWYERYRKLFNLADLFLCEGSQMAQSLVELGCPEHKVLVHHLGVGVDTINFKPRLWESKEPLRVLIAASFREKKGIPYALEALGRLQDKVPIEITIIGDANGEVRSQEEKQKILATISRNRLQSRVRMLGYQPYSMLLNEAYRHHIFLSPSVTATDGDTEGGVPVTIIEMAATGIPVVSTNHCDIPEVIHNGYTGLLAEERDVEGLVCHLEWLVENPAEWKGMVEAGRSHIEAEYNARIQGKRLASIYKSLADGGDLGLC